MFIQWLLKSSVIKLISYCIWFNNFKRSRSRSVPQKWMFLREIEEWYFKQKSRINWLKEGDLNTAYFHRICQTRACYNAIRAFFLRDNTWITDPLQMSDHVVNHFKSVLGPHNYAAPVLYTPPLWFAELTAYYVPEHYYQQMLTTPTAEEIRKMMFWQGLTSAFFKVSWEFIGSEVVTSILNFFASNFLPATANSTILTLVPKFPGATKITDFRPISCLNTIYKVISRLLISGGARNTFDRGHNI